MKETLKSDFAARSRIKHAEHRLVLRSTKPVCAHDAHLRVACLHNYSTTERQVNVFVTLNRLLFICWFFFYLYLLFFILSWFF